MTVSPFFHNSPAEIAVTCELVRGSETHIVDAMLPRVKQESVALNLSGVERIDAAGIAALITLYCSAIEAGNAFSVVAPSPHVLELLRLVGLEHILVGNGRSGHQVWNACSRSAA